MVTRVDATLAHSRLSRDLLAHDVQLACLLEVSAAKPGNVTPAHDFSDTTYADMVRSALALGAAFSRRRARGRGVGELIADGVSATARVTDANTNLGIVLLLAPLVRAEATRPADEPLRVATERILAELDVGDAAAAFAAIVAAHPGGLGDAPDHDVKEPARITLREAMAAAAHRDSIASEYATGYEIVFDTALPLLAGALGEGASTLAAIVSLHVGLLASHPDTLIERKAGPAAARAVTEAAREVRAGTRTLDEFDASLRGPDHRLNPGTTADLVAATLLAALLTGVDLP
ncbi:MAG TPA: triphosphoribosyl-dephospho-CoA synthase [Solirubrobacteraceae bacterium]|nr:triphosphoribosyl-dephospho-CoA synthase [Solirubrobacteraceae bacterium]